MTTRLPIRTAPRLLAGALVSLLLLSSRGLEAGEALSPAFTVLSRAGTLPLAPADAVLSRAFTVRGVAGGVAAVPPHRADSRAFTVRGVAGSTPHSPLHLAFSLAFTVNNPLDVAGVSPPGPVDGALRYGLSPASPNPFQSSTVVRFELPERSRVRLQFFDVQGRRVRLLLRDVDLEPGLHAVTWDGLDDAGISLADGRYYCVLDAGRFRESRSLLLLK